MRAMWLLAALSGCGCDSALHFYGADVRVELPMHEPVATYRFEIAADEEILTVSYDTMTFEDGSRRWVCSDPAQGGISCSTEGPTLHLAVRPEGQPGEQPVFMMMAYYRNVATGPERMTVRVDRDASRLVDELVMPSYMEEGNGCGYRERAFSTIRVVE